ncbi:MAG: mycothiol conjugate amidase Mca [Acidimicrobiaceae bacterium]|nr:mycothiol conjugate amidase Mca [Acidimicrobiaceae bacterium]
MDPVRTLMTVHAHPDDESSKTAGTVAKYSDDGVRTVLVCATGGEEGEILNQQFAGLISSADIADVRRQELKKATDILGYSEVYMLGYRDSGMAGSQSNSNPEAFCNVALDRATSALVEIIRKERPQVLITYGEDQSRYPHPDHLKVHEISILAFQLAGDHQYHPELGQAHQVSKLYYTIWSKARVIALHERYMQLGLESPFNDEALARPGQDEQITTSIDVYGYFDRKLGALRAHASQIDPNSQFFFGLSSQDQAAAYPLEDYRLAQSKVGTSFDVLETDLFAGI